MIEFAYRWVLILLLLVPLLYWYMWRFRKRPSIVVASSRPFAAVRRRRAVVLSFTDWCVLAAAVLLILALARPRFGSERVLIRAKGIDIVLALDMSGSMQAIDVPQGVSSAKEFRDAVRSGVAAGRLEVAKREIRRFIEARPNDRIGLIGFSDLAYSFAPPTLDHAWLLEQLARLRPGMIGDATGIASPIGSAVSRLKNSDAPRRVLVLFTDGTNTAQNIVTPEQAAKLAREFDVIIHTVGIGSANAYVVDEAGGALYPAGNNFDEKLLKTLAEITGGSYFRAADAEGMRRVMHEINLLEKTTAEQPKFIEYREFAPRLALAVLVLLLLGFLAENSWKLRLP